jgi:hypothetical protein
MRRVIHLPPVREIALRAQVEFTQFGVTLAARVIGISHDDPMRYDLRLEDGAIIPNIPGPDIGALMTLPSATSRGYQVQSEASPAIRHAPFEREPTGATPRGTGQA